MEGRLGARIGGHRRQVPGEPLRREEVRLGQGAKGIAIVVNETEAGALDEGVIDEETVPNGEPLNGVKLIEPDDMVDSRRGAMTSNGTTRGKLHAVSARSSGPHWPQERTGSIEAWGLPLHRTR